MTLKLYMLRLAYIGLTIAALTMTGFLTRAHAETGTASWYGFESGRYTADGRRFQPMGLSCAHRSYAFGTVLRVTDLATRRYVVVRVNDRGPARWTGRVIDLSKGAAQRLGIIGRGTARVQIARLR